MTLLTETLSFMEKFHLGPASVEFVMSDQGICTWAEFVQLAADLEYDSGYGLPQIDISLCIVGRDWWLERAEYDGSEWWEFKTQPRQPSHSSTIKSLRAPSYAD